ncbi:hypothetical protein DKX38_013332 [Salix brachista]|uniref:Uncharacterized protein n=1 Tax=Salix brachista TaxID=2182728 RepID=A0A5N5LRC1_9ROSI|nr:hypothetical protein DKX38_013332 [Salix brachista]
MSHDTRGKAQLQQHLILEVDGFDKSKETISDSVSLTNIATSGTQGVPYVSDQTSTNVDVNCPMMNGNQISLDIENGNVILLGKYKIHYLFEFYDRAAAGACKAGMNEHVFNGRPCIVAFASPQTQNKMGASYESKTQAQLQSQSQTQGRRPVNDRAGRGGNMNYQSGDGGRNYGIGGWGRELSTEGQREAKIWVPKTWLGFSWSWKQCQWWRIWIRSCRSSIQ